MAVMPSLQRVGLQMWVWCQRIAATTIRRLGDVPLIGLDCDQFLFCLLYLFYLFYLLWLFERAQVTDRNQSQENVMVDLLIDLYNIYCNIFIHVFIF